MPINLRLGILENYEYQENLTTLTEFWTSTQPLPPQIFRLQLQQTQASVNAFCKLCRYHTTSIKVDNLLGVLTLSKTQFPITLP